MIEFRRRVHGRCAGLNVEERKGRGSGIGRSLARDGFRFARDGDDGTRSLGGRGFPRFVYAVPRERLSQHRARAKERGRKFESALPLLRHPEAPRRSCDEMAPFPARTRTNSYPPYREEEAATVSTKRRPAPLNPSDPVQLYGSVGTPAVGLLPLPGRTASSTRTVVELLQVRPLSLDALSHCSLAITSQRNHIESVQSITANREN